MIPSLAPWQSRGAWAAEDLDDLERLLDEAPLETPKVERASSKLTTPIPSPKPNRPLKNEPRAHLDPSPAARRSSRKGAKGSRAPK